MFESLRKNIQLVQDGISAGLNRLSSAAPTPTTPPEGGIIPGQLQGGGADLLTMYQSQWATMHHIAVQNAAMAQAVAGSISQLTEECESQHSQLLEVRSLLAHLPNIMGQLHSSLSTIGLVRSSLEEVEGGLASLEDTLQEAAAQEHILDLRMKVTLRYEQRQHCLNMVHNERTAQYREKLEARDQQREQQRRQREETFEEQFKEDLQHYKLSGSVDKAVVASTSSSTAEAAQLKLEDVSLDTDTDELESFLGPESGQEVAEGESQLGLDTAQGNKPSSEDEEPDCGMAEEGVKGGHMTKEFTDGGVTGKIVKTEPS